VNLTAPPSAAVGELYANHHAWLCAWLRRKIGCSHGAADLAQDVFMRILVSRNALCGLREPRAYLTTTAQRLMVDRIRREVLEKTYLAELAISLETLPVHPSPEQTLLTLEALEQIAAVLADVPAKARQAFLLHYLEGLAHGEIAAQLQVSTRMVHKYLVHCLLQCDRIRAD